MRSLAYVLSGLVLSAALAGPAPARSPADPFAWATREMQAGRFDAALPVLQRFVRSHPEHLAATNNLAVCLIKLKRHPEAEKILAGLLARDPSRAAAHLNRGVAHQALAESAKAHAETEKAVRLVAEVGGSTELRAAALFNMGWLLDEQRDARRAASFYRMALEVRPRYAPALIGVAIAHARLGDTRSARQAIAQAQDVAGADSALGPIIAANQAAIEDLARQQPPVPLDWKARTARLFRRGWYQHSGLRTSSPTFVWVLWVGLQFFAFVIVVNVYRAAVGRRYPLAALLVIFTALATITVFLWGTAPPYVTMVISLLFASLAAAPLVRHWPRTGSS